MIAAQPGGCNAAAVHTTHGLTMPEEDGSGHPGMGKIGQKREYPRRAECGRPPIETRSVAREMLLGSATEARSNGFDRGR
jgi:hypothetical protein